MLFHGSVIKKKCVITLATVYGDICYSWYKGQYWCENNGKHELSLLKINSTYISSLTNRIALINV